VQQYLLFLFGQAQTPKRKHHQLSSNVQILYKYPDAFHDSLDHQNTGSVFSNSIRQFNQSFETKQQKSKKGYKKSTSKQLVDRIQFPFHKMCFSVHDSHQRIVDKTNNQQIHGFSCGQTIKSSVFKKVGFLEAMGFRGVTAHNFCNFTIQA